MATPGRIYRRTEGGRKAWDTQNPGVPLEYRRILGLMNTDIQCHALRARLGRYSESELLELLAELEQCGLVESVSNDNLDFTGSFKITDLQAAQANPQADLDFTGSFSAADLQAAAKKD